MSYQHLNAKERHTLMFLHQMKISNREIGRRLKRCHTTISREIERNTLSDGYSDTQAQKFASKRRKEPRHKQKQSNKVLKEYVIVHLKKDWSPETISGRLAIDFPRSTQMRISGETVYQ